MDRHSDIGIATPGDLGAAIRARRRSLDLRQEDLALVAGVGRRFLSELENGKPTARLGQTLAVLDALGLRVGIAPR